MGRFKIILPLLLLPVMLLGQEVPAWLDQEYRKATYPASSYLTGYSDVEVAAGEPVEKAVERARSAAQRELVESIRLNMKSSTSSSISSGSRDGAYHEDTTFDSITSKDASAEIVGLNVETYVSTARKQTRVSAFAYVRRRDLAAYYGSRISANLAMADNLMSAAESLAAGGGRDMARRQCSEAEGLLSGAAQAQELLAALGMSDAEASAGRISDLQACLARLGEMLDVRHDIADNLKKRLDQRLALAESFFNIAGSLLEEGEKSKARSQCADAMKMLAEAAALQEELLGVLPSADADDLQQERTDALHNDVSVMSARLEQAVMVYLESREDMLGKEVKVLSGRLKADMASMGCSFTDDEGAADFRLSIDAQTRESSNANNMFFCYADVSVQLDDLHRGRTVYGNEFSEKAGSGSVEKAARRALETISSKIIESISSWIK